MKIPENLFGTPKQVGGLQNRNSRIQNLGKKTYSKIVTNYQELLAAITEVIEANKLLNNIDAVDFFNGYEIIISDTIVVENTIYLDKYCSGITFVSDGRINIYPKSNLDYCFNLAEATSVTFDSLYITQNPLNGLSFTVAFFISDDIGKGTIRKYGTTIQNCVSESVDFCYISALSSGNNILFNRHKTTGVSAIGSIYIENSTSNLILGNIIDKGLGVATNSNNNRIIGNDIGNGVLSTSTSSGNNFIVGNRNYSFLSTHASDVVVETSPGGGGVTDGDKGDIVVSGGGTVWTVDANVVDNTKLATMSTSTIKGRISAGTGNPEDLTVTQVTSMLDVFTTALKGLVPASGGGTTNFLRADGTWSAPAGGSSGPTFLDWVRW
jgi:hypothetical protein